MYNKVFILGNAGRDPEVRHLDGGQVVANFSVATTEYYTDRNNNKQERVEWHNIVCWRKLAEFAEKYIRKGSQIFVEGKIRSRKYTDQNGVETNMTLFKVPFLGIKTDSFPSYSGLSTYRIIPPDP